MVYLSRGIISASVGISDFQRSSDLSVSPFLARAVASVSTTESTARNRLRCRSFWDGERRHGIFLRRASASTSTDCPKCSGTHHRRPPLRGFVTLNIPNMVIAGGRLAIGPPGGLKDRGDGSLSGCPKKRGSRRSAKPVTPGPHFTEHAAWSPEPRDPPAGLSPAALAPSSFKQGAAV
jgi:hypothetical protein